MKMSSFLDSCEKYFGSRNLYEIFKIEKDASEKEVRKAYHRLSLVCHPDRVDEINKLEATEKFKTLGKIHALLSDKEKRSFYDETGSVATDEDLEDSDDFDWIAYWTTFMRKITDEDIKKYEQEYKGSEMELTDIKKAYQNTKGDFDLLYEYVPFLTLDEEDRVRGIIQKMIDDEEVPSYDIFVNEPQTKRDRRFRKYRKEEKLVEREKKKKKESGESSEADLSLVQMIQARRSASTNFLDQLEKKYSNSGKRKRSKD